MTSAEYAAPVPAPRPLHAVAAPPRWFSLAAIGAGLAAALLTVDYPPGIGVTLAFLAVGAALLPAVRRPDWVLVGLGSALAVMPTVRDAPWLVALDVLGVLALGCLVLVGVRGWWSVPVAALSVPVRMLHAPTFLARGIRPDAAPVVRGVTLTGALLLVFGTLFASADGMFGDLAGRLFPDASLLPAQLVVFVVVTLAVGGGLLASRFPLPAPESSPRRLSAYVEWVLPLVALDLLFAVFVAMQFGPRSQTYAEYARTGFFQLLAVTALTFAVIAGAVRWAPPSRLLRVLLGVLCGLTGVVLVSAVRRLSLYEDAFGLSIARVLAHTFAFWLGLVLVLVVVAGLVGRASWLPRAVIASAAVFLVGLNVANPEALIARNLVSRYERTGDVDRWYLTGLGADAAPALNRLPEEIRACVLMSGSSESSGWPGFNLSRSRARDLLRPYASDTC